MFFCRPYAEAMPTDVTLSAFFAALPDPRLRRARRHCLLTLLFICLCGTLAGADGPTAIARWAKAKKEWLRLRVDLPNGLPSHDTIARVLAQLDAKAFAACFTAWTTALHHRTDGEVIALDGKTLRASLDKASGVPALHLVSAWACKSRLVLCQRKAQDHENEITAVPDLLQWLDVKGCIVTGDALLCQKQVAKQIINKGGDYVLALKDNHPHLHERTVEFFTYWRKQKWHTEERREPISHQFYQTVGKGHGRMEVRKCWLVEDAHEWLDTDKAWAGLRSAAAVECVRRETATGRETTQTRYFLTSLCGPTAAVNVLRAVRLHWGVENRLHWVLDVVFGEDRRQTRSGSGNGAQNSALLSKIALNLLRQEKAVGAGGVKAKRQLAGWDVRYMETVLTGKPYNPEEPDER